MLTGCVTSGRAPSKGAVRLSAIPADLQQCLAKEVPAPIPGDLSRQAAAELIAAFRQSDHSKTLCGRRVIAWWDAQRKVLAR
jgi:hypothetical protein